MTSHSDETSERRAHREPSKRSRHVDGSRGTGLGSIVRTSPLTPARSAWPRDAGPSRSTMYAVGGAKLFASPPTGHGWPTRRYTRLKAFGPAHGHYERTLQPGERSERTYWHHGSPDENALYGADAGPCRLQPRTRGGEFGTLGPTGKSCCSHLGGPGEPPGATRGPRGRPGRPPECPDGRRTAPTDFPAREGG